VKLNERGPVSSSLLIYIPAFFTYTLLFSSKKVRRVFTPRVQTVESIQKWFGTQDEAGSSCAIYSKDIAKWPSDSDDMQVPC
jgi:hypothetical protein